MVSLYDHNPRSNCTSAEKGLEIQRLHWHGATPTTSMTHIAIQEALEGKNVNWLQKVTDEEYLSGPQRQNGK
jgi:hypothetical protein